MSLDLNVSYILVLVLFLVPLLILNGIVFRPFLKLLEERHERLEGALERAQDMLDEAEARAAAFNERIKIATEKGIEKRAAIRSEAQQEMNARIDAEKQVLGKKLEDAMGEIDKLRAQAQADIQAQAEKIAELTAGKLLGRGI